MLASHEALVDYMTPLGLHHLMWGGHHYGPAPWWDTFERAIGILFIIIARTNVVWDLIEPLTGSNTVSQYRPPGKQPSPT